MASLRSTPFPAKDLFRKYEWLKANEGTPSVLTSRPGCDNCQRRAHWEPDTKCLIRLENGIPTGACHNCTKHKKPCSENANSRSAKKRRRSNVDQPATEHDDTDGSEYEDAGRSVSKWKFDPSRTPQGAANIAYRGSRLIKPAVGRGRRSTGSKHVSDVINADLEDGAADDIAKTVAVSQKRVQVGGLVLETRLAGVDKIKLIHGADVLSLSEFVASVRERHELEREVKGIDVVVGGRKFELNLKDSRDWEYVSRVAAGSDAVAEAVVHLD